MKKIWMMYIGISILIATVYVYVISNITWEAVLLDINWGLLNKLPITILYLIIFAILYISGFVVVYSLISKLTFKWDFQFYRWKWKIISNEVIEIHGGKICVVSFIIGLFCTCFFHMADMAEMFDDFEKWEAPLVIAHAGGEIDGYTYSNSKEAIIHNYKRGCRTFEIDFTITKDGVLAAKHDWEMVVQEGLPSGYVPTRDEFLSVPIYGKYTPMTLEDICLLMEDYEDIWIVTDVKDANAEEMKQAVEILKDSVHDYGKEELLDRFIVQVYNEETFDNVKTVYPFDNWIFTLYQCWDGNEENFQKYARFCCVEGIDTITMWDYYITPDIVKIADHYGIDIYVHTVNDEELAQEYINMGVKGIYSDSVMPDKVRRN